MASLKKTVFLCVVISGNIFGQFAKESNKKSNHSFSMSARLYPVVLSERNLESIDFSSNVAMDFNYGIKSKLNVYGSISTGVFGFDSSLKQGSFLEAFIIDLSSDYNLSQKTGVFSEKDYLNLKSMTEFNSVFEQSSWATEMAQNTGLSYSCEKIEVFMGSMVYAKLDNSVDFIQPGLLFKVKTEKGLSRYYMFTAEFRKTFGLSQYIENNGAEQFSSVNLKFRLKPDFLKEKINKKLSHSQIDLRYQFKSRDFFNQIINEMGLARVKNQHRMSLKLKHKLNSEWSAEIFLEQRFKNDNKKPDVQKKTMQARVCVKKNIK